MQVWTIAEWCALRKISRPTFYNLIKRGTAPRTMRIGRAVRISEDADLEWVRACEAPSAARTKKAA
ncbi:helix-turn-helix domain-containing protein [Methylobacterium sp. E-065]|uniref:helix-turn-helix transcriptional regulator n=1 Tax=Methylobacterium sp. E-065 TaxID=2836583 RepID=UPI001FBC07A6|nr:helix-turn-helix domain-containing protein [Methylobacterium sp. E-065]MCJ2021188.1 helix-turn-helix domain-containing protein [Methylobacterium sp. E-065]